MDAARVWQWNDGQWENLPSAKVMDLIRHFGWAKSRTETENLIKSGAVRIRKEFEDDIIIRDPRSLIPSGRPYFLLCGKKLWQWVEVMVPVPQQHKIAWNRIWAEKNIGFWRGLMSSTGLWRLWE